MGKHEKNVVKEFIEVLREVLKLPSDINIKFNLFASSGYEAEGKANEEKKTEVKKDYHERTLEKPAFIKGHGEQLEEGNTG